MHVSVVCIAALSLNPIRIHSMSHWGYCNFCLNYNFIIHKYWKMMWANVSQVIGACAKCKNITLVSGAVVTTSTSQPH